MLRFFRFDDLSHQTSVGVVNLVGLNFQVFPRLNCRGVVIELTGLTGGCQAVVQPAANVHIAHAVNLGMMTVVQYPGADIQPVTRGNHGGFAVLCAVIQGPRLEGKLVAVNAPGAGIVQGVGREMGQTAVNQSGIVQRIVDLDLCLPGADVTGGAVGKILRAKMQRLTGFYLAVIENIAGGFQGQIAIGRRVAGMVKIPG